MGYSSLTSREQEILGTTIQHCLHNPEGLKVNYTALAERLNFASENSASAAWSSVRRKLFSSNGDKAGTTDSDGNGEGNDSVNNIPKPTSKKRARKAATNGEGTPTKRARKGPKKADAPVVAPVGDEDEGLTGVKKEEKDGSAVDGTTGAFSSIEKGGESFDDGLEARGDDYSVFQMVKEVTDDGRVIWGDCSQMSAK